MASHRQSAPGSAPGFLPGRIATGYTTVGFPGIGCAGHAPSSTGYQSVTEHRRHRWLAWLCLALLAFARSVPAQVPDPSAAVPPPAADPEPITPIPPAPAANPLKLALGEHLFEDRRLSHNGTLACLSCHDIHSNGADSGRHTTARDGSKFPFTILTVFNAASNFRLNLEGNYRTLEAQTQSSLENPANMGTSVPEVLAKLNADPVMAQEFRAAYGHIADRESLLDAIATYERSLVTPGSRFDQWLGGDGQALTAKEQAGYRLFSSLGCISCHQGVNVGGNLFARRGVFHPLASSGPEILRVPSLRNVATLAPYFHDGSTPTLADAVRRMAMAQLDRSLSDQQIDAIVAFLGTLTGKIHGTTVAAVSP
jgi:cytochrome c peroxidase